MLSKAFERLIFNSMFKYFIKKKLFTECQPGFIPGDSCVVQLSLITHENYKPFNCYPPSDIKRALSDISKAFDEV